MKRKLRKLKNILRHVKAGSVIFVLIVLVITAGIATYVGFKIHDMKKENLLLRGEINTQEATLEYNRYLLTRADIVTMVSSKVEELLSSGTDSSTIEAYLTEETNIIISTLDPESTGLYGLLGGSYVDGAGWVPDEDYVPTERPWYLQTIGTGGKVTFVDPYLDAQTNTVMMTVSRLLNDGESVFALDVSLRYIQDIVEKVSSSTEGSQAFLLDENGIVIVHSDPSQLGKNYMEEPDSLGGIIARKLLLEGENQFDVSVSEGNYTVYTHPLEGGWFSISMIDADVWHRPMHRTMIIFAVILAMVVLSIFFVFLHMAAKNAEMQALHRRMDIEEKRGEKLQALSETDRMTGLYDRVSSERKVNEMIGTGSGGMFLELDIDDFKKINDTYGHQAGDKVIIAIADALRSSFRTNDYVMRLGGDEFGAFAVGIVKQDMAESLIRRLFSRINELDVPEIRGKKICVSAGAAICPEKQGIPFQKLYTTADEALYRSKKTAGNALTFAKALKI